MLRGSRRNPGGILWRLPWEIPGEALQIGGEDFSKFLWKPSGSLAKSCRTWAQFCKHCCAIALGSLWEVYSKCLKNCGHILGAISGIALGIAWGSFSKTVGGLVRFCGVLGRLPWVFLGKVLQGAWAILADCLGGCLVRRCRLVGRISASSLGNTWGVSQSPGGIWAQFCKHCRPIALGSLWEVCSKCLRDVGRILGAISGIALGIAWGSFSKTVGGFGQILWRAWAFAVGIPG